MGVEFRKPQEVEKVQVGDVFLEAESVLVF